MELKKTLYLLDFDGTLTKKDSLFDFLKFSSNPIEYYFKFLIFLPNLFKAFVGLSENAYMKEKFIAFFLKGKSENELVLIAKKYSQSIERIMRPEALKLLQEISKQELSEAYIVSASLDIWLKPIAEKFQLKLICTTALYENGIYTGKFASKNCNHGEKKRRILQEISLDKYSKIIAYGDSNGDKSMFFLAHEAHLKPFTNVYKKIIN